MTLRKPPTDKQLKGSFKNPNIARKRERARERDDGLPIGTATGPKGISEDQIEAALISADGVIADAARMLGCLRHNLSGRIHDSERLLKVLQESKVILADKLKTTLVKAALNGGDMTTARWLYDRVERELGNVPATGAAARAAEMAAGLRDGETAEVTETTTYRITAEDIALARRRHLDDSDDD